MTAGRARRPLLGNGAGGGRWLYRMHYKRMHSGRTAMRLPPNGHGVAALRGLIGLAAQP